ncbi:MAG: hypothetical protein WCS33_00390 [Candidatus Caldatribacteriota bacterium]
MGGIKRGSERVLTEKVFLDALKEISEAGNIEEKIEEIKTILQQIEINTIPLEELDFRGLEEDKPEANEVMVGTTYWSVDTGEVEVSNGTDWVVI